MIMPFLHSLYTSYVLLLFQLSSPRAPRQEMTFHEMCQVAAKNVTAISYTWDKLLPHLEIFAS